MGRAAARTGIIPTALVAVEQSFPKSQRVIDDALAVRMLPRGPRACLRLLKVRSIRDRLIKMAEKSDPGMWGGLLCRKRYIDDSVAACSDEIGALVSLGAGFDTRSVRLPSLTGMPIWELDQSENVELKEKRLQKSLGTIPANLKLLAVDFDHDDLAAALASQGYCASMRTFFVWEAVTQYLTENGVRATFNWLSKAASGSRLAFTYVRRDFLKGEVLYGWERGYKRFVETGTWQFGMDPEDCPAFLQTYGWTLIEDIGYEELARKYIGPTGRALASTQVERLAYSQKI